MTGRPWDASYQDGPAPWEIGGPQPAIVRVADAGGFRSPVLDAGCGSGDNALHLASLGLSVFGVDVAETAIAKAQQKVQNEAAEFAVADVYRLASLGRTFASVLDCGMFHTCDAEERPRYVESLASVAEPGAMLHLLCFRPDGPDSGPHPVRREELEASFSAAHGWRIVSLEPERVMTRFHGADGAPAWLAAVQRVTSSGA